MNTSAFIWLASVIGASVLLHYLINRSSRFYAQRYLQETESLPGYIHIVRRTLLVMLWLVALFLCSYTFFGREMNETITTHLIRSIWIGLVIIVCVTVNAIVLSLLEKRITKYTEAEEKDPTSYKFFRYLASFGIFLFGAILVAFAIPGLRSVAQSALAGAGVIAVVIGIASQEVLGNIVSGTFIVISKPFRVGDTVKINTVVGQVEDITLRHTVVNNFQNKRVVIPNAIINKEQIENYNLNERKVCEWVEVGISYDSDIDKAIAIMQDEAEKHPYFYDNRSESELKRDEPAVRAKVIGFGESSVNLRAWVWARNYPAGFNMRLDLYQSIKKRFDESGIEIPFPYRTLIFKNKESVDPSGKKSEQSDT